MNSRKRNAIAIVLALAMIAAMSGAFMQPARAASPNLVVPLTAAGQMHADISTAIAAYEAGGDNRSSITHLEIQVPAGVTMSGDAYTGGSDWNTLAFINDTLGVTHPAGLITPVISLPSLNKLTLVGVLSVPSYALSPKISSTEFKPGPRWLKTLVLPDATTLKAEALAYNLYMSTLDMPSMKTIEFNAVRQCNSLASVNIPVVETIGGQAFQIESGYGSLQRIALPSSLTSIGNRAFGNMNSLVEVTFNGATPPLFSGSNGIFYSDSGTLKSSVKIAVPSGHEQPYADVLYPNHIASIAQINDGKLQPGTATYTMTQKPQESNGYIAIVNAPFSQFVSVTVDGNLMTQGTHYSVTSGSSGSETYVTLFSSLISSLYTGTHNLNVNFNGGTSSGAFTVNNSVITPTLTPYYPTPTPTYAPPPIVVITDDYNDVEVNPDFLEQVIEIADYNVSEDTEEVELIDDPDGDDDWDDIDDVDTGDDDDSNIPDEPDHTDRPAQNYTPTRTATPAVGAVVVLALLGAGMMMLAFKRRQDKKRSQMM